MLQQESSQKGKEYLKKSQKYWPKKIITNARSCYSWFEK